MTHYKINISGIGTAKELIKSLMDIVQGIEEAVQSNHETALLDGAEWEDNILIATLSESAPHIEK